MSVAKGVSESLRSPVGRGMLEFFTGSVWQVTCGVIIVHCTGGRSCSSVVAFFRVSSAAAVLLCTHEKPACCSLPTHPYAEREYAAHDRVKGVCIDM